jgi:hypothetical protein
MGRIEGRTMTRTGMKMRRGCDEWKECALPHALDESLSVWRRKERQRREEERRKRQEQRTEKRKEWQWLSR